LSTPREEISIMKRSSWAILAVAVAIAGCGGRDKGGGATPPVATGGSSAPTTGGSPAIPGSDTGGSGGSGGPVSTGPADSGAVADDAGPPAGGSDGPVATTDATAPPGGAVEGWYEAEAIPPNEKAPKSEVHVNPATACKTIPPTPGEKCNAGGGEVTWITEGRQGWLQFNQVSAPADGMYDVTWWYHCGNNDNFGDKHCGGQTDPPTTPAGCRPHNIVVNGTEMPGTYHFPCFAGSFSEIHAATTTLPLKAGAMNSIKVYPKQRDSADMDAIQISPAGMGMKPLIKSNNVTGSN
jgi:hypothetical protein